MTYFIKSNYYFIKDDHSGPGVAAVNKTDPQALNLLSLGSSMQERQNK